MCATLHGLVSSKYALEVIQYLVCTWPESMKQQADSLEWWSLQLHLVLTRYKGISFDNVQFLVAQWLEPIKMHGILHEALSKILFSVVKVLVEQCLEEALKVQEHYGMPLHAACSVKRVPMPQSNMLSRCALHLPHDNGYLPLHAACFNTYNLWLKSVLWVIDIWPHASLLNIYYE